MRNKLALTKELWTHLSDPDTTLENSLRLWWYNIRANGGMRLTSQGYHACRVLLNLTHYEFNIVDPTEFTQRIILNLDRKLQTPYYILAVKGIPKKIIFFGSKEAVMINLYGDLKKYLDNYEP